MKHQIDELLGLSLPLPESIANQRANCFNAIQLYFGDQEEISFLGPEELVQYVGSRFEQVPQSAPALPGDVLLIWSRTSKVLPIGSILLRQLVEKAPGYPFGLVMEHACVRMDNGEFFQKRDPTAFGPYEVVSEDAALAPYLFLDGFEFTRHRRQGFETGPLACG